MTNWILEINNRAIATTSENPTVLTNKAKSFVAGYTNVNEAEVEMRSNWTYFDISERFYTSFRVSNSDYEVVVRKITRVY